MRRANASVVALLTITAFAPAACDQPQRTSSTDVAAPPNCAELWVQTREKVRASGQPDGEARRQADLERAQCEGLSPSEYPEGAFEEAPPCLEDENRRNAPPPADPGKVAVYFSCEGDVAAEGQPVYMFERDAPGVTDFGSRARRAVIEYLQGPTRQEAERGYVTPFGDPVAREVKNFAYKSGLIRISFSSAIGELGPFSTTEMLAMISQVKATAFQFPEVREVRIEIEGDCGRFWRMLESDCQVLQR